MRVHNHLDKQGNDKQGNQVLARYRTGLLVVTILGSIYLDTEQLWLSPI